MLDRLDSLLVVKPSSLGDVVHTLPSVHAVKKAAPHLKITWLVNSEWAPLLAGNPDLDRIIEFPRGRFRGSAGWLPLFAWLKNGRSISLGGLALDFQGLARSALLARWLGAKRLHCLDDAELLPRLLANRVVATRGPNEHAVERYLHLVSDLGVTIDQPLQFPLPAGTKPANLEMEDGFLLLHPFSRGENKSLAEADVERLCELLAPIAVVVAGRTSTKFDAPRNCTNLLNQTSLPELVWLIRHAQFVVSVDSGPMHIAAAITSKVLGIHTWTDPHVIGPYRDDAWVWKNGQFTKVREAAHDGAMPFRAEHVAPLANFLRTQCSGGRR